MTICNVAEYLISGNLSVRGDKVAFIDDDGICTYADLDRRCAAFAGFLLAEGLRSEERILLVLEDSIAFPVACLGAMRAGMVPVMANPLLPAADLAYLIEDSRARMVIASRSVMPRLMVALRDHPQVHRIVVAGAAALEGTISLDAAIARSTPLSSYVRTHEDEACMWQYSSGSTGRPKGTIHSHGAVAKLTRLYPREILDLGTDDVTFSAAKMFFGYGFGNSLIFPLSVGATAVLMADRPTADAVWQRIELHQPSVFYGVPTLYNSMMHYADRSGQSKLPRLRACVSAGEALSAEIGLRWRERYEVDILDGIGSTEMLHIYISNRPDDVVLGSTGRPLSGYEVRIVGDDGLPVPAGTIGELHVRGPTSASGYWCKRERTAATFRGEWVASGDKFVEEVDGRYTYAGRSDDMLKVGGIYVSPLEVEQALNAHPAVAESAVVGWPDEAGLIKPKAYVVLAAGQVGNDAVSSALKAHVKSLLAPYKYPRWISYLPDLPKTASGKIERYKLRIAAGEVAEARSKLAPA